MALFEVSHPAAQEINLILRAAELGLGTSEHMPPFTKLNYQSPLESDTGAAIIRIANWDTSNMSTIHVPIFTSIDTTELTVTKDGERTLTEARIVIADFLGKPFKVKVDELDEKSRAPYIQFDVISEGVLLTAPTEATRVIKFGVFESEMYLGLASTMRSQASLEELHEASLRFLDQAA